MQATARRRYRELLFCLARAARAGHRPAGLQRAGQAQCGRHQRCARAAGIKTRIGNHSFRATGMTARLKNGGTLEHAQQIPNYASPRTTKLYDRRADEITPGEVEKIRI